MVQYLSKMKITPSLFSRNFCCGLLLIWSSGMLVMCTSNSQETYNQNLQKQTSAALDAGDWETVLTLCNRALEEQAVGQYTPALVRNTKLALLFTGELLENFFSYHMYFGFHNLFPDYMTNEVTVDQGFGLFFRDMGLQTLAMAVAFNRYDTEGKPSALNDFIQSALIGGDYRAAKTAVNRLEQYRGWQKQARIYKDLLADTNAINTDPFYIAKRKLTPEQDFLFNFVIDRDMHTILNIQNNEITFFGNQRAFEYVLLYVLLQKGFISEMYEALSYFDYTHIPRHLEEAILIHIYLNDPETPPSQMEILVDDLKVRTETIQRFEKFLIDEHTGRQGQMSFELFRQTYGDTYWFYYWFYQLPTQPSS